MSNSEVFAVCELFTAGEISFYAAVSVHQLFVQTRGVLETAARTGDADDT